MRIQSIASLPTVRRSGAEGAGLQRVPVDPVHDEALQRLQRVLHPQALALEAEVAPGRV